MKHDEHEIKMGEIVNLSSGEYSDFTYNATVVFLRDCNIPAAMAELKKEYLSDREKWEWTPNNDQIVTWLIANQYCAPVLCREYDLGSYSEITVLKNGEYASESKNNWEDERDETR